MINTTVYLLILQVTHFSAGVDSKPLGLQSIRDPSVYSTEEECKQAGDEAIGTTGRANKGMSTYRVNGYECIKR